MSYAMIWDDEACCASSIRSEGMEHEGKFAFVNFSNGYHLNSSDQIRVIRRHAMKDVGKSRRKPRMKTNSDLAKELRQMQPTWWLPRRWATLSTFSSHVKLPIGVQLESDVRGRQLLSDGEPSLHFQQPIVGLLKVVAVFRDGENGGAQVHLRDAWFTLGLRYASTMFQILANSALHETITRSGARKAAESYDSMRFHVKALSSLQVALQATEQKDLEYAISAITGLLVYEELCGNRDLWIMHHQGLQHLINRAGGIDALEQNEELRVTISWCELRGACVFDLPPCYPSPRQWEKFTVLPLPSTNARTHLYHVARIWNDFSQVQYSEWLKAYEIVAIFSLSAFSPPQHQNPDLNVCSTDKSGAWVNPVVHTFLSRRQPADLASIGFLMQEACRFGMLLYLNHVRRFLGITPSYTGIVVGRLKEHLMKNYEYLMGDWIGEAWILQIWVLYMAGFGLQGEPDEAWFFRALGMSLKGHGISDWKDVLRLLKSVLWFEEVFDKPNDERVQIGSMWWII